MGVSGGGYFRSERPENVRDALRKEEMARQDQIFETQVSNDIGDLLGEYNNRNADAVRKALERLKKALENDVEDGTITPVFGGSVRKRTYVDGISDIDSLFVLKGDELTGMEPSEALDFFESKVRTAFTDAKPDKARMSLRIPHEGVELELLPAAHQAPQQH